MLFNTVIWKRGQWEWHHKLRWRVHSQGKEKRTDENKVRERNGRWGSSCQTSGQRVGGKGGWEWRLIQGTFPAHTHILMQIHLRDVHPCILFTSIDSALVMISRNSDYVQCCTTCDGFFVWEIKEDEQCFASRLSRKPFATFPTRFCAVICGFQSAPCFSSSCFSTYTFLLVWSIICCSFPLWVPDAAAL